jgi:hypothetical protein
MLCRHEMKPGVQNPSSTKKKKKKKKKRKEKTLGVLESLSTLKNYKDPNPLFM